MQILVEIARLYYDHFDTFIEPLSKFTFEMAQTGSDQVAAQAIEFWSTICEAERERQLVGRGNERVSRLLEPLLELLLECIQRINFEEEEDDEVWGASASSVCCLRVLAQYAGNKVIERVISFASTQLTSDEWKRKHVALVALGAILDGPDRRKLAQLFQEVVNFALVPCYDNVSVRVRETSAWVFSQIAEFLPEVLVGGDFAQLLQKFCIGLKDTPAIANYNCAIISELAKSIAPTKGETTNALSPYLAELFMPLIQCASRPDACETNVNLSMSAFSALANLAQYAAQEAKEALTGMIE